MLLRPSSSSQGESFHTCPESPEPTFYSCQGSPGCVSCFCPEPPPDSTPGHGTGLPPTPITDPPTPNPTPTVNFVPANGLPPNWYWIAAITLIGVVVFVGSCSTYTRFTFKIKEKAITYLSSLYYSVVTLTGVGYGDITPSNDVSKIVISLLMLGVAFLCPWMDLSFQFVCARVAQHWEMSTTSKAIVGFFSIVATIGLGVVGFKYIEGKRLVDSIYGAITSATGVGYGDIYFSKKSGKAFACLWLLLARLILVRNANYVVELAGIHGGGG